MPQFHYVLFVFFPTFCVLAFLYYRWVITLRVFSKIESQSISGGYEAARIVLDRLRLFDIHVEKASDDQPSRYLVHRKLISLSPFDYESCSLMAIGMVQHQVGHAIQHMRGRPSLFAKAFFYPWIRLGGFLSIVLTPMSLIPFFDFLYPWGAFLFTLYMLFVFLILPLEMNASREVYNQLADSGRFPLPELNLIRKVLQAASLRNLTGLFHPLEGIGRKHVP